MSLLEANEKKPEKGAKSKSKWRSEPPLLPGLYASPATAALAALLDHEEREHAARSQQSDARGAGSVVCSWEQLLELTSSKLETGRSFKSLDAIQSQTEFCEAWEQVIGWSQHVVTLAA